MKNPVQKMLKAASQMKNNPQLAQREAQSPNKVNAIAAQMVIPEQQAMQNSKPIPHPVGSVLMQKLAQAQQAAMAAKMPQPSEGGIAQMAAKGGVLKFAKAGEVPKGRRGRKKTETVAQQTQKEDVQKFVRDFGAGPSSAPLTDPMVEAFNAARNESVDTQVDAANRQRQQALGEGIGKYQEALAKQERVRPEVEGLRRIGKNVKSASTITPERKKRQEAINTPKPKRDFLSAEDVSEQDQHAAEREASRARANEKRIAARRGDTSLLQSAEKAAPLDPSMAKLGSLRSKNIPSAQDVIKGEIRGKSSVIGEKGRVVPRYPATPEQKRRRAKVSSELGLPEKGGIASAASKEAREYMAGKEQPAAPKTEKPAPKPDISREEADTRLASAHAEGQRKKTAQSPATMMGDINDAAHSIITSNPEWADKIAKASAEFNAKNPNATTSERGAYLRSIAPQEAIESLLGQLSPTLEKHGLLFSKEGGIGAPMMEAIDEVAPKATPQSAWNEPKDFKRPAAGPSRLGDTIEGAVNKGAMGLQAYSALAPIANVALDPNKSKADVAREAKYQAVQSSPTIGIGSAVGSGIGESIDKVNEWLGRPKTDYGAALSALGAYGGKGFSGLTRDVMRGKGDESPNLTAKQTLPSVGSLVDTGVEKAKGLYSGIEKAMMDERLPADREREEELQALLAQEEASRGAPATQQTAAPSTPSGTATPVDKTALSRVGKTANPMPSMTEQNPQGRAPAGQTVGYQPSAGGAAAPSAPQAPRAETQATQDQYAGDTSEGTPEGAVRELMKLRGPGYSYSPEVMGMLKDARDEDRQATALSMLAGIGAGLANRDRYAGAHDAALLANQAFTSGREREDAAQQRFLQGIIHNEQVPFEQRQAAYEMYTKMQMAAAQNEALYGRALLSSDARRYAANMGYAGRVASGGGRDWAEKQDIEGLHIMLKSIDKELESNPNDPFLTAQAKEIRNRLANLSGLSGGKELGQTAQKPIDLDIR